MDHNLFEIAMNSDDVEHKNVARVMQHLAVSHTVIKDSEGKQNAESPDELAFVAAAKAFGFDFVSRNTRSKTIKIRNKGQTLEFQVMQTIEFTSDRKCMSVLVRIQDKFQLQTKGADSVIFGKQSQKDRENPATDLQKEVTEEQSTSGLRTLAIAQRKIDKNEAIEWSTEFDKLQRYNGLDKQQKLDAHSN